MSDTPEPITIFILSWERPLYLWVTLDSLYRHTKHPVRFILADNNSQDPLVRKVVDGFRRRNLFHAVEYYPENDPENFQRVVDKYSSLLGTYFGCVESDVEVLPSEPCWLTSMLELMEANPRLQYLGSLVDPGDFVDVDAARRLAPGLPDSELFGLVKAFSPEKQFNVHGPDDVLNTDYRPAGRLNLYRTSILKSLPIMADGKFNDALEARGDLHGVALKVRHRHLSLLNIFDYPEYDTGARDDFFARLPQE